MELSYWRLEDWVKQAKGEGWGFFIRHAHRTGINNAEELESADLTPLGQASSRLLGAALRDRQVPVRAIFSSPVARCVHTAEEIASGLGNPLTIQERDILRHRVLSGKLGARACTALGVLLEFLPEKGLILAVTHDTTISRLLASLYGDEALFLQTPDYLEGFAARRARGRIEICLKCGRRILALPC